MKGVFVEILFQKCSQSTEWSEGLAFIVHALEEMKNYDHIKHLMFSNVCKEKTLVKPVCFFRNATSHGSQAWHASNGPATCSRSDAQPAGSTSSPACCHQTSVPQRSTGGQHSDLTYMFIFSPLIHRGVEVTVEGRHSWPEKKNSK